MNISAYYQPRYTPKYKPSQIDIELISKVGQYKSQMYEQNLAKIKNLQASAINIDFMREDANQALKTYNDEIQKELDNSNFQHQDLSDVNVANKYIKVFDKLSQDTDLQKAYKIENNFKTEVSRITSDKGKENSKYHDNNFIVWQNEEGGVKDYLNASSYKGWNKAIPQYSPYHNVQKEISTLANQFKLFNRVSEDVNSGYKLSTEYRDPNQVYNFINTSLSSEAKTQLMIDSKARVYSSGITKNQLVDSLYDNYIKTNQNKIKLHDDNIADYQAKLKVLNNEVETDEIKQQKEVYKNQINNLLTSKQELLNKKPVSKEDYSKKSLQSLTNDYAEIDLENRLQNLATSVSGVLSKKISSDPTELAKWKLNMQQEQFKWKMQQDVIGNQFKSKELELKESELGIKASLATSKTGTVFNPNVFQESNTTAFNELESSSLNDQTLSNKIQRLESESKSWQLVKEDKIPDNWQNYLEGREGSWESDHHELVDLYRKAKNQLDSNADFKMIRAKMSSMLNNDEKFSEQFKTVFYEKQSEYNYYKTLRDKVWTNVKKDFKNDNPDFTKMQPDEVKKWNDALQSQIDTLNKSAGILPVFKIKEKGVKGENVMIDNTESKYFDIVKNTEGFGKVDMSDIEDYHIQGNKMKVIFKPKKAADSTNPDFNYITDGNKNLTEKKIFDTNTGSAIFDLSTYPDLILTTGSKINNALKINAGNGFIPYYDYKGYTLKLSMDSPNSQTVNLKIFNRDGQCINNDVVPLADFNSIKSSFITTVNTLITKK